MNGIRHCLVVGASAIAAILALATAPTIARAFDDTYYRAGLTGPSIKSVKPGGEGEFLSYVKPNGVRVNNLEIEAVKVHVADGTILTIKVNNAAVGSLRVHLQRAAVVLSTERGAQIPLIGRGDRLALTDLSVKVVLSGTF